MKMQLRLGKKSNATIVNAYAPTMRTPEETKDKFYEELRSVIASAKSEKLIILGDFSARVGTDHHTSYRVLGKHGF